MLGGVLYRVHAAVYSY